MLVVAPMLAVRERFVAEVDLAYPDLEIAIEAVEMWPMQRKCQEKRMFHRTLTECRQARRRWLLRA